MGIYFVAGNRQALWFAITRLKLITCLISLLNNVLLALPPPPRDTLLSVASEW